MSQTANGGRAAGPAEALLAGMRLRRIGLVSRDYRPTNANRRGRGFGPEDVRRALAFLDAKKCDTALFSLHTLRGAPDARLFAGRYNHLRHVFLEYLDSEPPVNVAWLRHGRVWSQSRYGQRFSVSKAPLTGKTRLLDDVRTGVRISGNATVLLCGETNIVHYNRGKRRIEDPLRYRAALSVGGQDVSVILNPVHDLMIRYEMVLKRAFLSRPKRWVISVWNRGKRSRSGRRLRAEAGAAWTVFHDGRQVDCRILDTTACAFDDTSIQVGVVDV